MNTMNKLLLTLATILIGPLAVAHELVSKPVFDEQGQWDNTIEVASSDTPFIAANPQGCAVKPNPAYWNRLDVKAAIAASDARVKVALAAQGHTKAAAATGKDAIRFDAAGNVILRVGFLVSQRAVAEYGSQSAAIADLRDFSLPGGSSMFEASGTKIKLEYAGVQFLDSNPEGTAEARAASSAGLAATRTTMRDTYLVFKANTNANIVVVVVGGGGAGVTSGGIAPFDGMDATLASGIFPTRFATGEIKPALGSDTIAHEIGHLIGQEHGINTDQPRDPLAYRMYKNFPYSMGYEALVSPPDTSVGVATMMTYNNLNVSSLDWLSASIVRFSDPNATVTVRGKTLALGRRDLEDSVQALQRDRLLFAYGSTPNLKAWKTSVVEYYHAGLNQYFSTAVADNIELLDSLGVAKTGWARTGVTYDTVSTNGDPSDLLADPADAAALFPVYRFYGDPTGPNTHFYSIISYKVSSTNDPATGIRIYDNDVDQLKKIQVLNAGKPNILHMEGMDFRAAVTTTPGAKYGDVGFLACKASWTPVYRLYNGENSTRTRPDGSKIDGNHRFAATAAIRAEMINKGWVDEGIAWCLPPLK